VDVNLDGRKTLLCEETCECLPLGVGEVQKRFAVERVQVRVNLHLKKSFKSNQLDVNGPLAINQIVWRS
jgi:hypothetical protein